MVRGGKRNGSLYKNLSKKTDVMSIVLGEAAEVLGVSVKELKRQSLAALLEKELRTLRAEILYAKVRRQ